jgi:hypothetical protein
MADRAVSMLEASRRPLTATERRLIRSKIRSLTARGRRASTVALPISGGVVLILWILTALASDAPWLIVSLFWLVVGGVIAVWVHRDMRVHGGHFTRMAHDLESALRRNAAEVYDIHARAFAVFEEIEDEGACYAFELEGHRLVFISGQEFYEGARFPSLDFSLVYVLNERGETVDMFVEKRGAKSAPARTIPAASKAALDLPEHLEVRPGSIDNLEATLTPASADVGNVFEGRS